ncbi:MAG: PfkB family carbohydrate kinase [Terracidiphilus sp.]
MRAPRQRPEPSLAVFGSLTIDDLVFPDGTTRWAVPGGSAVYAALGASLWTEYPSIVAPLGDDYPRDVLNGRIDLSRCTHLPRTLRNWGLYEEDGTRYFVSRSASRNWNEFCPMPEDAASGHQTAAHIAPAPHNIVADITRELRKGGPLTISLDLDDHDLAGQAKLDSIIDLLRDIDLFLPSLHLARSLFGGTTALEVLHRIRSVAPDVALIAVKCGAEGVIAHAVGTSECVHVPAVPVELVDPTGAGDAFCGGALASFMTEGNSVQALLSGTVSASFCVEGLGLAGLAAATKDGADGRLSVLRRRASKSPFPDQPRD